MHAALTMRKCITEIHTYEYDITHKRKKNRYKLCLWKVPIWCTSSLLIQEITPAQSQAEICFYRHINMLFLEACGTQNSKIQI